MKKLLLLIITVSSITQVNATTYHIAANGNDASNGTSAATAWRTLARANTQLYAANDSILLRRGDVFYGSLIINRNNINVDAYGTGARPLITGFTSVPAFTADVMPGVYKAYVNAKSNLHLVTINNVPQQIGRFPNSDAPGEGWLMYEISDTAADYIGDAQLTAFPDWTDADVVMRGNDWTFDIGKILAHKGNNIYYGLKAGINDQVTPKFAIIKKNHGYFIQNDKRTLDKYGEWFFDSAKDTIYIYTGEAAPVNVKVATVDTLISCNTRTFVSIKNIDFEGTNVSAIFSENANDITVKDCGFTNMGAKAVFTYRTGNVLVENITVYNSLSNAIQVTGRTKNNVTVRSCTVKNNALMPGMGSYYDYSDYKAIVVQATSGVLCENNRVDSCAMAGIDWQGSDVMVRNNIVLFSCLKLHDEGPIYSFVNPEDSAGYRTKYINRTVKDNLVMYAYGNPNGSDGGEIPVAGIYLDGISPNVDVINNTCAFIGKNGVHTNNFWNIRVYGNTFYNVVNGVSSTKWPYANVGGLSIKQNVFVQVRSTDKAYLFNNNDLNKPATGGTYENYIRTAITADSNYFYNLNPLPVAYGMIRAGKTEPVSQQSLANWTAIFAQDKNSKTLRNYKSYKITALLGANLVSNSLFNSNTTGWTLSGSSTNFAWYSNAGRFTFTTPAPTRYSFVWTGVGPISTTKKYLLRFSSAGSSYGNMIVYLRSRTSPYADIIARQTTSLPIGSKLHEFLFNGPSTVANAAACISIDQGSGTTSIDNVQLYECTATVNNVADSVVFYPNLSAVDTTIKFTQNRTDAYGTRYKGSAPVPARGARVFFFESNIVSTVNTSNAFLTRKRK